MSRLLMGGILALAICTSVRAATINVSVPVGWPTIQAGINAAMDGDTVLVAPGTYTENINFLGKQIVLIGAGMNKTFLQPADPFDICIRISNGEGAGTELTGFCVSGGGGLVHTVLVAGGALPVIRNCLFRDNILGDEQASLEVISCQSTAMIRNNLFINNGGISCVGIRPGGEGTVILNNTFDQNARGFFTTAHFFSSGIAKNNIVTNSTDYGASGNFTELDHNCFQNNSPNYGNFASPGLNDIIANPLYCNPSDIMFALDLLSPCVGSGENGVDRGAFGQGCTLPETGGVIHVPTDFPTIQEAIIAADSRDTVLVAPGVYVENINFLGKAIKLIGASGPALTILQPADPSDITVRMISTEGSLTELTGFSIIGGAGPSAIRIENEAAPFIHHNVFRQNSNFDQKSNVVESNGKSNPIIAFNLFHDNIASIGCVFVYYQSNCQILNNTFDLNWRGISTMSPGAVVAKNNIITNSFDFGVLIEYGTSDYNCVFGNLLNYSFGSVIGEHDVNADPLYCDVAQDNYSLASVSPCVGTGDGGMNMGPFGEGCIAPPCCNCDHDPLCDDVTDVLDLVLTITIAFRDGPVIPDPNSACPVETTDVNCDGVTDVFDVLDLVAVTFQNADPVEQFCEPCGP